MNFGRRFAASRDWHAATTHRTAALDLSLSVRRALKEIAAVAILLAILGLGYWLNLVLDDGPVHAGQRRMNRFEFYLVFFGVAALWLPLRFLLGLPKLPRRRGDGTASGDGWFDAGGDSGGDCGGD